MTDTTQSQPLSIAVYGASGMVGSRIAAEAAARGHRVTGISRRGDTDLPGVTARAGDLADAADVRAVAAEHDVVVSATGPSRTGAPHSEWLDAVDTLIANAGSARILFVGGAGSLLLPDGSRLLDSTEFPAEYKAEALSGADALDRFRAAPEDVDWTFLSPAPAIAPGERTGAHRTGGDEVIGDHVTAEDYAAAMVDEIEAPAHRRARFTVAS
jgi:putative NADH-flavin reductase